MSNTPLIELQKTEVKTTESKAIELKGSNFTLSVIHLYDSQPDVIRQALADKIAQAPAFLKNAPVVINIADLAIVPDWQVIEQAVREMGLRPVGVSGCKDSSLKAQILQAGLALLNEGKTATSVNKQTATHAATVVNHDAVSKDGTSKAIGNGITHTDIGKTRLITTPVRSGQRIYVPQGDLVVISPVSAGAELIADGNIHIYGMMRGRALAGASGDKTVQIFASRLQAELVSIAGVYWLSDQILQQYYDKAMRLHLVAGALVIEPLE